MAHNAGAARLEADPLPFSFQHTLPRRSVHRSSLSETFLTDSIQLSDTEFAVGAQLPPAHPYYADHICSLIDPLLLLECCRQAETYAAHEYFGIPYSSKFVLKNWQMGTYGIINNKRPRELVIAAEVVSRDKRKGILRQQSYAMSMQLEGTPIGEVAMDVSYVPDDLYLAMRHKGRSGQLPSSSEYQEEGFPCVPPERVGRRTSDNVLINQLETTPDVLVLGMRVHGGHPSLFDHAQDHHPGMVLMEAARQAAILSTEHFLDVPVGEIVIMSMEAAFSSYAELDDPVQIVADKPSAVSETDYSVPVLFVQNGQEIARMSLRVSPFLARIL